MERKDPFNIDFNNLKEEVKNIRILLKERSKMIHDGVIIGEGKDTMKEAEHSSE